MAFYRKLFSKKLLFCAFQIMYSSDCFLICQDSHPAETKNESRMNLLPVDRMNRTFSAATDKLQDFFLRNQFYYMKSYEHYIDNFEESARDYADLKERDVNELSKEKELKRILHELYRFDCLSNQDVEILLKSNSLNCLEEEQFKLLYGLYYLCLSNKKLHKELDGSLEKLRTLHDVEEFGSFMNKFIKCTCAGIAIFGLL